MNLELQQLYSYDTFRMPAHDVKQELRKFLNASYADITQRKIQAAKSDQKELLEETIH